MSTEPLATDSTPVVVDGAWRQALTVIRSLGRAGHAVTVVRARGSRYLERSRYVTKVVELPPTEGAGARLNALVDVLGPGPLAYYPIGDSEIRFTVEVIDSLPAGWTPVLAPLHAIETCADKEAMAVLAQRESVPGIETVAATTREEICSAAESLGFPCLVKGINEAIRHKKRKAFVLRSVEEARREFADWRGTGTMLVQTYMRGPRWNVYYFARAGEVLGTASAIILRTDTPDGTGLAVEGLTLPDHSELRRHTESLVRGLAYSGAGCAQFLVDDTSGRIGFLEVNARLGANFAAAYRAGLDLPTLSVRAALGEPIDASEIPTVERRRRYVWTGGDALGLLRSVAKGRVGPVRALGWFARCVVAAFRADDHITLDRRDLAPSWSILRQRLLPGGEPPSL